MKLRCKCAEATPVGEGDNARGVSVKLVPTTDEGGPASIKFRLTDAEDIAGMVEGGEYDVDVTWTKAEAPAQAAA